MLRAKTTTRDKEDHFIMIEGSIHQQDVLPKTFMYLITELQKT